MIHLAALQVPFCRADPPLGALVNVVGTVNLFEAVKRRLDRMAPLVYTSSMGAYSAADVDSVTGRLHEGVDGHPTTHYGVYKVANEGTARIYALDNGLASIGFRPMTVYGAGRDQGMTSSPTVAIAAAVLGVPFTITFGGTHGLPVRGGRCATLIIASRSSLERGTRLQSRWSWRRHADLDRDDRSRSCPEAAGLIDPCVGGRCRSRPRSTMPVWPPWAMCRSRRFATGSRRPSRSSVGSRRRAGWMAPTRASPQRLSDDA